MYDDIDDHHIVQLIPATDWTFWELGDEGPEAFPVPAFGLRRDGEMVAMRAYNDGSIGPIIGKFVDFADGILLHRTQGTPTEEDLRRVHKRHHDALTKKSGG